MKTLNILNQEQFDNLPSNFNPDIHLNLYGLIEINKYVANPLHIMDGFSLKVLEEGHATISNSNETAMVYGHASVLNGGKAYICIGAEADIFQGGYAEVIGRARLFPKGRCKVREGSVIEIEHCDPYYDDPILEFEKFPSIKRFMGIYLGDLPLHIQLELLRRNYYSHPNPSLYLDWINGKEKYPHVKIERTWDFNCPNRQIVWSLGSPTMTDLSLIIDICAAKKWTFPKIF